MPFDNYLVILKLDENQMEELLNYIKKNQVWVCLENLEFPSVV